MNDRDIANLMISSLGGNKNIRSIEKYGNEIIIGVADKKQCNVSEFEGIDPIEEIIPDGSNIEIVVSHKAIDSLADKLAEILNNQNMQDELEEEEDEPFPGFNNTAFQSLDEPGQTSFISPNGTINYTADIQSEAELQLQSIQESEQAPEEEFKESEEITDKKALKEAQRQARIDELAKKQAQKQQAKADELAKKQAQKQAKIDEANRKKAEAKQAKDDEIARKQAAKQAKIDEKARKKAQRKAKMAFDDFDTADSAGFGMYSDIQPNSYRNILQTISNIFLPIIPAFIACGMMTTVYKIILIFYPSIANTNLGRIASIIAYSAFSVLPIIVGYNSAREFGGSSIIGAVLALVLTSSSVNGISLAGISLIAGSGGTFSILAVSFLAVRLELFLRQYIPRSYNRFLNPIITIIIMSFLGLLAIQPLGGLIAKYIAEFMRYIVYTYYKASGTASLLYLPVVMVGLQDGLYTVNTSIIQSFGATYLLPIICMSGAGQVGACLYVFLATNNPKLKNLCFTSLPLGILGIGEPLMWGVTVPLGRPFIASCIGAAFGGTFIAFMRVSTNYLELSGLPLTFFTDKPFYYLAGLFISYITGFLCCMILKFKDPE